MREGREMLVNYYYYFLMINSNPLSLLLRPDLIGLKCLCLDGGNKQKVKKEGGRLTGSKVELLCNSRECVSLAIASASVGGPGP